MSSDPKRARNRNWRVGADEEAKRPWRKSEVAKTHSGGRRWTMRTWRWPLVLLFFITIGVILWLLFAPRAPRPAYLVILGTDHAQQLGLPVNAAAWQGARALHDYARDASWTVWFTNRKRFGGPENHTLKSDAAQDSPAWANHLALCEEKTVLLYLTAHGGVDEKGAFLVPEDAKLFETNSGANIPGALYLKSLLSHLPEQKNKVILLEAMPTPAHWGTGQLHGDFARMLFEELERDHKDKPNLVVFCATDAGQRTWDSPTFGKSIFGHFVYEGLKGAADTDRSEIIDTAELTEWVKKQTEEWTIQYLDEVQTPKVWHSNKTDLGQIQLVVANRDAKDLPDSSAGEDSRKSVDYGKRIERVGQVWAERDKLAAEAPAPAIYSPHLWREYLDRLLRYEHLVLLGDPGGVAASHKSELDRLAGRIRSGRILQVSPEVASTSLAMPAAFGQLSSLTDAELRIQLTGFREAAKEDWTKSWATVAQAMKVKDSTDEGLLRARVCRFLLHELSAKAERDQLKQVWEQVSFLVSQSGLRPREAHYLCMLHDGLETRNPGAEPLRLALRVRLLAEETSVALVEQGAHPFSERVYPWIKVQVERGDQERRLGEDRLFGEAADWQLALKHLGTAEKEYLQAREAARLVRQTLEDHARVATELPYYTAWIAAQRPTLEPSERNADQDRLGLQVRSLEQLWSFFHQLTAELHRGSDPKTQLRPLAEQLLAGDKTKNLKGFNDFAAELASECNRLASMANQTQHWHAIRAALTVPLQKWEIRKPLLEKQDFIQKRYSESAMVGDLARRGQERMKTLAEDNRGFAQRQGRLAIASLGQPWIDRRIDLKKQASQYRELGSQLTNALDLASWQPHVNLVGRQVGALVRRLPAETQAIAELERKHWLSEWNGAKYLEEIQKNLTDAAELCRQLDGGGAAALSSDPVQLCRKWSMHELLLWQGRRAWEDHWEYEDQRSKKAPYFLDITRACLLGAESLVRGDIKNESFAEWRLQRVAEARKLLVATTIEVQAREAAVALTTEEKFKLAWEIKPSAAVPRNAVPLCRVQLSKGVSSAKQGEDLSWLAPLEQWSRKEVTHEVRSYLLDQERSDPRKTPERPPQQESATLEVLFRGRKLSAKTDLNLYLGPDTVAVLHPPPPNVQIAVRAEENIRRGAVAIILDYSGSMAQPFGEKSQTKQEAALAALGPILDSLEGTRVSFWLYGHDLKGRKGQGIGRETVVNVRPLGLWRKQESAALFATLRETYEPYHLTPLAESLIAARKELLADAASKGLYKTILVLTDGEDTTHPPKWIEGDPQNASTRAAAIRATVLREFGVGVLGEEKLVVNMVLFSRDKEEKKRASAQFEDALKNLPQPGQFLSAGDGTQLAAQLREALRPRVRIFERESEIARSEKPIEGTPTVGYKVNFPHEQLEWSWPFRPEFKNVYQAQVHASRQQLAFNLGDRLLMQLRSRENRIEFERRPATEEYKTASEFWKEGMETDKPSGWRLAVHKNRHDQDAPTALALDMLTTIENHRNIKLSENDTLGQSLPSFRWFELHSPTGEGRGLRWGNSFNYIAPAYTLRVAEWDHLNGKLLKPNLKAWWWYQADLPGNCYTRFEHRANGDLSKEIKDQPQAPGVFLEGITFERRQVEVSPGQREGQDCLVVRLRHERPGSAAPYRPVWVRLRDRNYRGEEHHFYREPGKVTAVFWPIVRLQEDSFTLHLVSLETFKRQAIHAELQLSQPDPRDLGPTPVFKGFDSTGGQ